MTSLYSSLFTLNFYSKFLFPYKILTKNLQFYDDFIQAIIYNLVVKIEEKMYDKEKYYKNNFRQI